MTADANEVLKKPESKHKMIIFDKMAQMVGLEDIDEVNLDEVGWYNNYQWTEETEEEFGKWMENYLKQNKEARRELMAFPRKSKKAIHNVANEFILRWGWKYKEKED